MNLQFSNWLYAFASRFFCLLILCPAAMTAARSEGSWTEVRITQVSRAETAIGDTYQLLCVGTRCHGRISLDVSGVRYEFEAMALFSPREVRIAIEPVPNEAGQLIYLHTNRFDPIIVDVGRESTVATKMVALVELAQPEKRPLVKQPVVRWGVVAKVRVEVRAPASAPLPPVPQDPI
jgi:hypothetical protein